MSTAEADSVIDQLLNPVGQCLTPEVAQRLVELTAGSELQARVDDLADKANDGSISEAERAEYEQYVRFSQFISLLQIKARNVLEGSGTN